MTGTSNVLLKTDPNSQETQEWLDAIAVVIEHEGAERAHYLIERLIDSAREEGINLPYSATTQYINAPREALCSYRMGFRSAAWRNKGRIAALSGLPQQAPGLQAMGQLRVGTR